MDWNRAERPVLSGTRLLTLVTVVSFFAGALSRTSLSPINTHRENTHGRSQRRRSRLLASGIGLGPGVRQRSGSLRIPVLVRSRMPVMQTP